MLSKFREPGNGLTHLIGAVLSVIGLVVLVARALPAGDPLQIFSFVVFGLSLILLYSTSATYHIINASKKTIAFFRKLDHGMIYVLIAGTYTPICLMLLRGPVGYTLLSLIWAIAICGIFLQTFLIKVPRWVYTLTYVLMGWLAVFALSPLVKATSLGSITLLLLGGVLYTIGAVIYATKKPNFFKDLVGFHEIFHVFVVLGSISHFMFIFLYC
ncbi:MAG: PAQR family membrane homeostasis protein TrhA [Bacillota bacterium]|jgi:hemolysin III|nr:hemolysin III family protein [Bacillota bacterium]NLU53843.1 hemolysin III family protein [Bacillota bacterium]HOA91406.1 hemolysin III family protein [Bacillota bacterium]HOP53824.1 hemolysin III family protein [Bacillota bacterium]HPT61562.1 hemolysin III family protein [Bacillota bacterium]